VADAQVPYPEAKMIDQPARNADYLDRPEARSLLRARPVAAYLGARRGLAGYITLSVVAAAAAVEAWRYVSPWLGLAVALVPAHAVFDWVVSWYRVGSLAYRRAAEQAHSEATGTDERPDESV
jgi:hypothetical protein